MEITSFRNRSLAAILFLALQVPAWAHALLDHSDPKVGSTVTRSPAGVKIWYTQQLEPALSSMQVRNARGEQVDGKDARVNEKTRSLLEVSLPPLPPGNYTVIWKVVSVDRHRTQGRFQFTIK